MVVFWHWRHFYYVGTQERQLTSDQLPWFDAFFLFYTKGDLAVELFFTISGFVFCWLYASTIESKRISAGDFALLRFSRLYPLHFATLIFVAIGQHWFRTNFGSYFVYRLNDARHFLLNLAFASSWGLQYGFSFNGPVWSVSVEILLYAAFFFCCRFLPVRLWFFLLLSLIGFLISIYNELIGFGVAHFFAGACVYFVYHHLGARAGPGRASHRIWAVTAAAWLITILGVHSNQYHYGIWAEPPGGMPSVARFLEGAGTYWPVALFSLTILAVVLLEHPFERIWRRLSFLGDISYSSYLLHFPLQMVVMGVALKLRLPQWILGSPALLVIFIVVLIFLSLASYHFFELPAQRFLRRKVVIQSAPDRTRKPAEAVVEHSADRSA